MSTTLVLAIAGAVAVLLLIVFLTSIWKVPAADEALIVTGAGAHRRSGEGRSFRIVSGSGALVLPVLQKAQYLSLKADKANLEVEGVDSQKIPVGVRGVAIFKVGDDERSITNAATRFLEGQDGGQMHDLVQEVFHGHLRAIIGGLSTTTSTSSRATTVASGSACTSARGGSATRRPRASSPWRRAAASTSPAATARWTPRPCSCTWTPRSGRSTWRRCIWPASTPTPGATS